MLNRRPCSDNAWADQASRGGGVITLIIKLGEGRSLTDDQYLGNILVSFICGVTALCFVAAATCGTRLYCRDGMVVERILD